MAKIAIHHLIIHLPEDEDERRRVFDRKTTFLSTISEELPDYGFGGSEIADGKLTLAIRTSAPRKAIAEAAEVFFARFEVTKGEAFKALELPPEPEPVAAEPVAEPVPAADEAPIFEV